MTSSGTHRLVSVAATAVLLLTAATACATPELPPQPGDDLGSEQARLAEAVEAHFADRNGTVTWNGSMLILELDGDADSEAREACEDLDALGAQMDSTLLAFPNGEVACEEALFG